MPTTCKLIQDDCGLVVSTELILFGTVIALALMTGLTSMRDGIVSEISDVAGSVQDFNQSYSTQGTIGHSGTTTGSDFQDGIDFCDSIDDPSGEADNCIRFGWPGDDELRPPVFRHRQTRR
jgi:hypothetical protein